VFTLIGDFMDSPRTKSPPRLLAVEPARCKPGAAVALHLLLTLSDLFIIALCTNPPIPFVGDTRPEDIDVGMSN